MSATPWASPNDITDAWIGDDPPTDEQLLAVWIGKAERKLRNRKDLNLTERMAADPPELDLAENVRDVIVSMVTRVLRNPEGVRTRQSTTGPFNDSVTFGGDIPGQLTISDEELELLATTTKGQRAFTVTPGQLNQAPTHPLFGALVNGPDEWAPGANP